MSFNERDGSFTIFTNTAYFPTDMEIFSGLIPSITAIVGTQEIKSHRFLIQVGCNDTADVILNPNPE